MSQDPKTLLANGDAANVLSSNSYHSAILRDPFNQRWGTAMDVAIGQAKTLDIADWQALWIAIADWKTPGTDMPRLAKYASLNPETQGRIDDVCTYYESGTLPSWTKSAVQPALVVSETITQREKIRRSRCNRGT